MAKSLSSFFVDDAAVVAMNARVPGNNFNSGVTVGASNSPGIGISTENPGLEQSLPNWTLLDQFGNARANQIGQHIGGPGISAAGTSAGQEGTLPDSTIRLFDNDDQDGSGGLPFPIAQGAELSDLATGWEEGV